MFLIASSFTMVFHSSHSVIETCSAMTMFGIMDCLRCMRDLIYKCDALVPSSKTKMSRISIYSREIILSFYVQQISNTVTIATAGDLFSFKLNVIFKTLKRNNTCTILASQFLAKHGYLYAGHFEHNFEPSIL